ncbi:MAG: hypothetical protein ACT4SY_13050 [Hyphomicrobiales bacterium]
MTRNTKILATLLAAFIIAGAANPSRAHEANWPGYPGNVVPGGPCPPGQVCEPQPSPPDQGDPGYYLPPPADGYPGYYLPPRHEIARVGCRKARSLLIAEGFRHVATLRCGGRYHSFSGWRYGARLLVRVYSRGGGIKIIRPY